MTSSLKQLVEVAREKCFQTEGQTDCGNLRRVITSTLKQLVVVAREKFPFKEKYKLIVVTKEEL